MQRVLRILAGRSGRRLRTSAVLAMLALSITSTSEPAAAEECPADCPEIAGISCVSSTQCTQNDGADCTSPLIPEECLPESSACSYVMKCTGLDCSGQYEGLKRLECRLEEDGGGGEPD